MAADLGRLFSSPWAQFRPSKIGSGVEDWSFGARTLAFDTSFEAVSIGLPRSLHVVSMMASNLHYQSASMAIGHNGNPKVSTVFWREISEFVEDAESAAD
jgi:hypothetical protein